MPNGLFPWGEYRKWRERRPPVEEEEEDRPPKVLRALELAEKYKATHPWLAKWLKEIPQPPTPEPTPAPTFTPAFEELTKMGGAVGGLFELGQRAGPLVAAPFAPKVRERVTKRDVLPTPEPPEGLPPSRMREEYEKLPGVAKFFAEEAIFLPLYLAGGFGAKRAVEGLTRGLYKRFAEIAPRIEAGERLAGKDRLLYEVINRVSKGRIETVTPQMEEEILRELYGTARITTAELAPGEVAKLAGRVGVKPTLAHIPVILQKELGALGWTIDDMSKMTKVDAVALRGVIKSSPDEVKGIQELLAATPVEVLTKTPRSSAYEIATYNEIKRVAGGGQYVPEEGAILVTDRLSNKIGLHELGHAVWDRFFSAKNQAVFNDEFAASRLSKTLRAKDFPSDEFFGDIFRKAAVGQAHPEFPKTVLAIRNFLQDIGKRGIPEIEAVGPGVPFRWPSVGMLRRGRVPDVEAQAQKVTAILDKYEGARWAKPAPGVIGSAQGLLKLPNKARAELYDALVPIIGAEKARVLRDWRPTKIRQWLEVELQAVGMFRKGKRMTILLTPEQKVAQEVAQVEALTNKLAEFVRTMKPERVKAELTAATIRKQQAARLGTIQEQLAKGKISGEVAHKRMLGTLKGELPKAEVPVSDVVFTRGEVSSLKQIIGTTTKLPPLSVNRYIRLHTMQALNKLLSGEIPTERGLALLERVFGEKFVKAFLRQRTLPRKIWVGAIEAMGLVKSVRASWDISAFYRQGAVILTARPQQIPAALKTQIKSVFSDKQALAIHDACHATPWEGVMQEAKLYRPDFWSSLAKITEMEEAYVSRLARRIPGIKRSERAYIVGLNKIRTDFFGYQAEQWSKMGIKASPEDYRHLARAINILTGRGDVRGLEGALTNLNAVLFSPRFQLSRLMTPTLLFDSSPLVRKMAATTLAKFYGFWSTMFGATALLAHEDLSTDLNPLSTNFGKIRYKDTWIDPIAGYGPWFRFISRLMAGPIYAVAKTINEDDVARLSIAAPRVKSTYSDEIREADLMRLAATMLRTKLSPAFTPVVDFMLGRTMVGKEVKRMGLEEQLMEYWSPLAIQAMIEAVQEEGFVGGGIALPEFIGFGVYTIPVSEQLVSEINERYTDYRTMKTKHNELIEEGKIEQANKYAQEHTELLYGVMYGRVAKAIRNIQDQIRAIEDDEDMPAQEKEETIESLTTQIIELAVGVLGQEVTGEKGVPQSRPPSTPQRPTTTGAINPFLR